MPRFPHLLLAIAALSASASAQNYATQSQAAPIQRPYRNPAPAPPLVPDTTISQPAPGVLLRIAQGTVVTTTSNAKQTEIHLTHGIANVSVHDPDNAAIILVDLPAGQTQLMENGLYTFNTDTNTVRVLKGEARAFPGHAPDSIKVKEYEQVSFAGPGFFAQPFGYDQARIDLLPGNFPTNPPPNGDGYYARAPYPYYAPTPYYAGFYGYPGIYGYPYAGFGFGYGYPGISIGIGFGGYYGGYRGYYGGYRRW